jgi:hypothetical protein
MLGKKEDGGLRAGMVVVDCRGMRSKAPAYSHVIYYSIWPTMIRRMNELSSL